MAFCRKSAGLQWSWVTREHAQGVLHVHVCGWTIPCQFSFPAALQCFWLSRYICSNCLPRCGILNVYGTQYLCLEMMSRIDRMHILIPVPLVVICFRLPVWHSYFRRLNRQTRKRQCQHAERDMAASLLIRTNCKRFRILSPRLRAIPCVLERIRM